MINKKKFCQCSHAGKCNLCISPLQAPLWQIFHSSSRAEDVVVCDGLQQIAEKDPLHDAPVALLKRFAPHLFGCKRKGLCREMEIQLQFREEKISKHLSMNRIFIILSWIWTVGRSKSYMQLQSVQTNITSCCLQLGKSAKTSEESQFNPCLYELMWNLLSHLEKKSLSRTDCKQMCSIFKTF